MGRPLIEPGDKVGAGGTLNLSLVDYTRNRGTRENQSPGKNPSVLAPRFSRVKASKYELTTIVTKHRRKQITTEESQQEKTQKFRPLGLQKLALSIICEMTEENKAGIPEEATRDSLR